MSKSGSYSINVNSKQGRVSYENDYLAFDDDQPDTVQCGCCRMSDSVFKTLRIVVGMLIWWTLNVGYNIYNKRTLNATHGKVVWLIALSHLLVGAPISLIMWGTGLRKLPKVTAFQLLKLTPIAFFHLLTHVGAVMSMSVGAVSFTQIVKATEPVISALLAGVILGNFFSPVVYLTLIPIIGGVGFASLKGEIGFAMGAFLTAMVSNVSSAMRGVVAKKLMKKGTFTADQNMTPSNIFAIMTLMSTVMLLPVSLILDLGNVKEAVETMSYSGGELAFECTLAMLFYFYYNEMAFLILDWVHPVTQSVGNTMKRVFVIISAVVVFQTPMDSHGIIGSCIAIVGALFYSIAAKKFNTLYKIYCIAAHKEVIVHDLSDDKPDQ